MRATSTSLILCICLANASAQSYQVCQRIVDKGLREYDIQNESQASQNSIFDHYCEQDGSSKQNNIGGSLDVVVKAIPIGLKLNSQSSEEQMRSFCKSYSAVSHSGRTSNSYKETIANKAYDSFDKCVALVSRGVSVEHNVVNRQTTSFFLRSGVNVPLEVRGVMAVNAKCSGQRPDGSGVLNYGQDTRVKLGTDTLGFTCSRTTQTQDGKMIYPEGTITITTNFENYDVFLPRDEQLPENLASNLQTQIAALQAKTNLELTVLGQAVGVGCQRINDIQVCWGTATLTPAFNATCPCSIFSAEFQFARGFSTTPALSLSAAGKTSGLTYVIYSHDVTADKITLSGHDTQYRNNSEPWVVTYIAIGKPK